MLTGSGSVLSTPTMSAQVCTISCDCTEFIFQYERFAS